MIEDVTRGEEAEAKLGELETALSELQSFADLLSHQLKAPLLTVAQFNRRLGEEARGRLDERQQEFLRRIQNAGRQMTHILRDLRDLSDVTRARVRIAEVDLSSLAQEIVDDLRARFPKRNVVYEFYSGMTALGDDGLLRLLLTNLLQNSWKYAKHRNEARIEFRSPRDERGVCTYCVGNNGVGFDNRNRKRIFEPLERLHTVREIAGTGFGLATAARVIRQHGGEIWAEGELGRGATFYFSLGTDVRSR